MLKEERRKKKKSQDRESKSQGYSQFSPQSAFWLSTLKEGLNREQINSAWILQTPEEILTHYLLHRQDISQNKKTYSL